MKNIYFQNISASCLYTALCSCMHVLGAQFKCLFLVQQNRLSRILLNVYVVVFMTFHGALVIVSAFLNVDKILKSE